MGQFWGGIWLTPGGSYFDHTARDSINHQNIPVISSHPFPLQVVISSLNSCVSSPGLSSYYLIICSGQCLVPDRRMDLRTCSAWIWNIILASTADCGGTDRHINRQTKNIQTDRQTDGQTDGWIFAPVGMNQKQSPQFEQACPFFWRQNRCKYRIKYWWK